MLGAGITSSMSSSSRRQSNAAFFAFTGELPNEAERALFPLRALGELVWTGLSGFFVAEWCSNMLIRFFTDMFDAILNQGYLAVYAWIEWISFGPMEKG